MHADLETRYRGQLEAKSPFARVTSPFALSLDVRRGAMSDADASAVVADDGAAAAVAPVVALWRRCEEARLLQRNARALELADRALEQAQRCLPDDSLVLVWIATEIMDLHSLAHVQPTESGDPARVM